MQLDKVPLHLGSGVPKFKGAGDIIGRGLSVVRDDGIGADMAYVLVVI